MEQEKIECDEDGCKLEVYNSSKCILHCEKDENFGKLKEFWDEVSKYINGIYIDKQKWLNIHKKYSIRIIETKKNCSSHR